MKSRNTAERAALAEAIAAREAAAGRLKAAEQGGQDANEAVYRARRGIEAAETLLGQLRASSAAAVLSGRDPGLSAARGALRDAQDQLEDATALRDSFETAMPELKDAIVHATRQLTGAVSAVVGAEGRGAGPHAKATRRRSVRNRRVAELADRSGSCPAS